MQLHERCGPVVFAAACCKTWPAPSARAALSSFGKSVGMMRCCVVSHAANAADSEDAADSTSPRLFASTSQTPLEGPTWKTWMYYAYDGHILRNWFQECSITVHLQVGKKCGSGGDLHIVW